ncbi:hypothetical protein [Streptomyces prunicolor]|uniref:hypothetical protein n=1 Tax=Streptomyces prunicolor TaxID=67348 RepID=UPI0034477D37
MAEAVPVVLAVLVVLVDTPGPVPDRLARRLAAVPRRSGSALPAVEIEGPRHSPITCRPARSVHGAERGVRLVLAATNGR